MDDFNDIDWMKKVNTKKSNTESYLLNSEFMFRIKFHNHSLIGSSRNFKLFDSLLIYITSTRTKQFWGTIDLFYFRLIYNEVFSSLSNPMKQLWRDWFEISYILCTKETNIEFQNNLWENFINTWPSVSFNFCEFDKGDIIQLFSDKIFIDHLAVVYDRSFTWFNDIKELVDRPLNNIEVNAMKLKIDFRRIFAQIVEKQLKNVKLNLFDEQFDEGIELGIKNGYILSSIDTDQTNQPIIYKFDFLRIRWK